MHGRLRARAALRCVGSGLLALGLATVFGLRLAAAWYLPTHDHDTGSLISVLHGGFRPAKTLTDIAHPGGLEALMEGLGRVTYSGGAATAWFGVFGASLAAAVGGVFFLARTLSGGALVAAAAALAYLMSPVLVDLAARGEENLLFHAPLAVAVYGLHRSSTAGTVAMIPLLAASGVLLVALHLQPFTVLAVGSLAAVAFAAARGDTARGRIGAAALAFTGPGLVFLLGLALLTPLARPNYLSLYYSSLHHDSRFRYVQSFLLFAQGYLLTGRMPHVWRAGPPGGFEPASAIWLLGLPALLIVGGAIWRLRVTDCITLAGLGFALAYEPSSSERWDTVLVPLLLALASTAGSESTRARRAACATLGLLLLAGATGLPTEARAVVAARDRHEAMRSILGGSNEVFVKPAAAVGLATAAPHGLRLRNLDRTEWVTPGAVLFVTSPDGIEVARKCSGRLRPLGLGFHVCASE